MGKKKPTHKLVDGHRVPLSQIWCHFIALYGNKADLPRFGGYHEEGEVLPERNELITGGGFSDAKDAMSTRRDNVRFRGSHEEADTRLILHSCETVSGGYESVLVYAETHMSAASCYTSYKSKQLKCG